MHTKPSTPAAKTATVGLLAALAIVLSFLESLLPPLPIHAARLGLSNLATMFALHSLGLPYALAITCIKAGFALFRGSTAFLMSFCGGIVSVLVMALIHRFRCFSLWGVGVAGAVSHNIAQLIVALFLFDRSLIYYAPFLLLTALVTGSITGLTVQGLFPALQHLRVRRGK